MAEPKETLHRITTAGLFPGGKLLNHALRMLGLTLLLVSPALAQSPSNRTYVGLDIYVAPGQQVHNVTCIFCSVEVDGSVTGDTTVLFGNLTVSGWARGTATVVGGNAIIESQARIGGTTVVLGGNAIYEADDAISGNAYVLGGHLSKSGERPSMHTRMSLTPPLFFTGTIGALVLLVVLLFYSVRRRVHVRQVR